MTALILCGTSTRPDPDDRIEGGRVFKEIDVNGLRTRAQVGKSGYTIARDFLDKIDGKLTQSVWDILAQENIDALGFEVEVDATAGGSPPFSGVTGLIGISVVWFTNTAQGVTSDPQVYLFTKWGTGGVEPLRKNSEPLKGCFFVVNDSGKGQSTLGPDVWEAVFPNVGVGQTTTGGPLLSGMAFLIAISVQNALLYLMYSTNNDVANALFTFGTGFAVVPGEKRPFRITGSAYEYDQWLLERLEFLERPHGQTWTPPEHKFWENAGVSIPTWSGSSGYSRLPMSLALSALNEEDDWIKNNNPATKLEENSGVDQLQKLEDYYKTTHTRSQDFSHSVVLLKAKDEFDNDKEKDIWVLAKEDKNAWSAVFISYVADQAGVPKSAGFAFSSRHVSYISLALVHKLNGTKGGKFRLYEPTDIDPKIGDILCKNRKGGKHYTVSKIKSDFLTSSKPYSVKGQPGGRSHCDLVIRKETIDGTKYLETIGGNTYDYRAETVDTAGRKRWMLTENGDWVMVGADNKVLGSGSSTKHEIRDTSEPKEEWKDQTIWDPKKGTKVSKKDEVFGFIRYEKK